MTFRIFLECPYTERNDISKFSFEGSFVLKPRRLFENLNTKYVIQNSTQYSVSKLIIVHYLVI